VICGSGSQSNKNSCNSLASVFASEGFAVISLNNMGHGYGPLTTTTVTRTDGSSTTVSTPGSGYDADGNGTIEVWEPRFAPRPNALHATAGSALQSAASVVLLVRAIQAGFDVDGEENLPLRDQPPVVTAVPGARAVRQLIDRVTWVEQVASTVAIAPFLRRSPPAGSSARPFILQFARSDTACRTRSAWRFFGPAASRIAHTTTGTI
jgi:hypothetical protein